MDILKYIEKNLKINIKNVTHWLSAGEDYDEETEVIQINFTYGLMKNFEDKYKYIIMMDLTWENLIKLSKKDRMVEKYMEEIERINRNPKFIEYMSYEEDLKKRENTMIKSAREEGIINRNIEIAKKMKEKKYNIDSILELTGLSREEIEKL